MDSKSKLKYFNEYVSEVMELVNADRLIWERAFEYAINNARSLLAEEQAQESHEQARVELSPLPKPSTDSQVEGLREAIRKLTPLAYASDDAGYRDGFTVAIALAEKVVKVLSRHPAAPSQEPLAVLADRKGFYEVRIQGPTKTVNAWDIELCSELEDEEGSQREKTFDEPIYASAESAARAYLESLPDVEREGTRIQYIESQEE